MSDALQVLAVVGVFSGTGDLYAGRRKLLRATWFPPTEEAQEKLLASWGISMRFVVGRPNGDEIRSAEEEETELKKEERLFGRFFRLDVMEDYSNLVVKVTSASREQPCDIACIGHR